MYFAPRCRGFPWNLVSAQGVKKLELWATRWSKFDKVLGSQCRTAVRTHCCKGDAASQWEMAILGLSEFRDP